MSERQDAMSKTQDICRAAGVFNDIGFFNAPWPGGTVLVSYHAETNGPFGSRAFVRRFLDGRELVTDPDAHWSDGSHKTFTGYGHGGKRGALEVARTWAGERYGVTEWARSPFGGYGPREFVKARMAEIKQQVTRA